MKIEIEIENCQDCPFGWSYTNSYGETSMVCDELQDNVGEGLAVHEMCPLKEVD